MHAYPPRADDPPSTDNTPWGVALGQTLATPRMPDPQTSPLASGHPTGPLPPPGSWGVVGGSGDAHASNSPSPAGEAALTTPTDLLLQVCSDRLSVAFEGPDIQSPFAWQACCIPA